MKASHSLALFLGVALNVQAGSATWNLNPTSSDWNTLQNWTPQTVPRTETDVATFGASNTTSITCGRSRDGVYAHTIVGSIVFAEDAPAYTIIMTPVDEVVFPSLIEVHGEIINRSDVAQNFVAANSGGFKESGRVYFQDSGSAGENIIITNEGGASSRGDGVYGGFTQLWDSSSAGKATFISEGGEVAGSEGGSCSLLDSSNAESATFISNPGKVADTKAGISLVQTFGNIGNSAFIANPALVTGAEGGWVEIDYGACAGASFTANGSLSAGPQAGQIYVYGGEGYATFTGKGGNGSNAQGGLVDLFNAPASAQTVVKAENGTGGGLGGQILIEGNAPLDQPQFELYGNGTLDLTPVDVNRMTIGSLAGDGVVLLAGHTLEIGPNNLSTLFAGTIMEEGAVAKVGSGTLTLSGANLYDGGSTVSDGTLVVSNPTGSGTGPGPVQVDLGTLGGSGTIAGKVTVGSGNGTGAGLAPAAGTKKQATLTIQSALTFQSDSTYTYTFKARRNQAKNDKVVANGVTINSGAGLQVSGQVQGVLRQGLRLTLLSNTATTPISGTFANLADGAILKVNGNTFQANYEGGDGNDLTLTVTP